MRWIPWSNLCLPFSLAGCSAVRPSRLGLLGVNSPGDSPGDACCTTWEAAEVMIQFSVWIVKRKQVERGQLVGQRSPQNRAAALALEAIWNG